PLLIVFGLMCRIAIGRAERPPRRTANGIRRRIAENEADIALLFRALQRGGGEVETEITLIAFALGAGDDDGACAPAFGCAELDDLIALALETLIREEPSELAAWKRGSELGER